MLNFAISFVSRPERFFCVPIRICRVAYFSLYSILHNKSNKWSFGLNFRADNALIQSLWPIQKLGVRKSFQTSRFPRPKFHTNYSCTDFVECNANKSVASTNGGTKGM